MELNNYYNTLAEKAFNFARSFSSDFECLEIYFSKNDYLSLKIEENTLKHVERGKDEGFSIRSVSKNGSMGFAFSNQVDEKHLKETLKTAIKMMKNGTSDPEFRSFPPKFHSYPRVKKIYDKQVENLQVEDLQEYLSEMINRCKEEPLAISHNGVISVDNEETQIYNSNGLGISGKETFCSVYSSVIFKDKVSGISSSGFEYQLKRFLKDLKPKYIVELASNNAKMFLYRRKIKSMRCSLVLTPLGTKELILKPIASAINAESFQYNRTFLVGKRGKEIGPSCLNIIDDALIDGAIGSSNFDDEGVPCKTKDIFLNGIFLNSGLLHNWYTANKENIESTGNAYRSSYSSKPSIDITNLILKPGDVSKDELISTVKKGVLLNYTNDKPNISTGDFSGLVLQGNLIENGKISTALNETMVGINILDLLKNIQQVSREFKIYGSYRAPWVKVKDVQIIGSAP